MSIWTAFTPEVVWESIPTDVQAFYNQWIVTYPDKSGRFEELVGETVQLFRQAVASNPENGLDPDETLLPVTGFRHALNTLLFNLMMETGAQLVPEVYTLMTRADIWLRQVQRGSILPSPQAGNSGSPSYEAGENVGVLL